MPDTEPTYPFVKFKRIKKIRDAETGSGKPKEIAEVWYLRIDNTHNQVDKLDKFERLGSIVVGHGNLEQKNPLKEDTYAAMRNAVNRRTGAGVDPRLHAHVDAPVDAMSQKVANERQKARA